MTQFLAHPPKKLAKVKPGAVKLEHISSNNMPQKKYSIDKLQIEDKVVLNAIWEIIRKKDVIRDLKETLFQNMELLDLSTNPNEKNQ